MYSPILASAMGALWVLFFIYPALLLIGITGLVVSLFRFGLFSCLPAGALWAYAFLRMDIGTVDSSENDTPFIVLAVLSVAMCIAASCCMAWLASARFPQSIIDLNRFYLVHRKFRFLSCLGIQLVIAGLLMAVLPFR
jgi:hypothetical protein